MNATDVDVAKARIRDWISRSDRTNADLASEAGVDEKTIRQAVVDGWNPTTITFQRVLKLVPVGWHVGDPMPAPRRQPRKKAA